MKMRRIPSLQLVLAFAALSAAALAQIQVEPAKPPAGLKVELQLGDGKRTAYHIGEVIPFSLIFSATDHAQQWVSAELPCETPESFPTTIPPGALATRGKEGNTVCMGHGWMKQVDLAATPLIQTFVLNHQYVLNTPGTYGLVWKGEWSGLQLTSNVVHLELLPRDPAWEAKQLALAQPALDTRDQRALAVCDTVGYLGTPAAELAIARSYNGDPNCPRFLEVLLAAKDHAAVLHIMEARIDAPEEIITPDYLRAVALVYQNSRTLDYWGVEQPTMRYARRLAAALPSKQPYVRAQCIFHLAPYHPLDMYSPGLPPDVSAVLREQMPAVFLQLSGRDQGLALNGIWHAISSPAMIPVLVSIIEKPYSVENWDSPRGLALTRLFELDPKQARTFLMQAIVHDDPQLMVQSPDEQFPQLDAIMLQRLTDYLSRRQNHGTATAITAVRQFASAAIEPQVRALLDANFDNLTCDEQFDLMTYLHRTNPAAADEFFTRVQLASAPRCGLGYLVSRYWSPAIERAELARLDSSDPNEARDALQALKRYASPAARPVIVRHLESWSAAHKSKVDVNGNLWPSSPEEQLGGAYFDALTEACGWNTSREEAREYGKLSLGRDLRSSAEGMAQPINQPIGIGIAPESSAPPDYYVGQCRSVGDVRRLKDKIAQYPRGTAFQFRAIGHSAATVDWFVVELGPWMTAHGYELSVYREPAPGR